MVEMVVESVRVNLQTYQRVVVLKEKDSERYLPIWIGNNEADAIVIKLQNVPVPRPQTHDLLKSVIAQLGAKVTRIVVTNLADDVYYAVIEMEAGGRHLEIDSRPSDAIALAVRMEVPIYAEESVLEKGGVTMSSETEAEAAQPGGDKEKEKKEHPRPPQVGEDELRKLSAFRDFINTLDLDDLGGPGH